MQAPQSHSASPAHGKRQQPCASIGPAGVLVVSQRVLSEHVWPSPQWIGAHRPSDPQRSPSSHESVVHAGRQNVPRSPSHVHGTGSCTHTSPAAQSAELVHSCGVGMQMPHARGVPGGTHGSPRSHSTDVRHSGSSGGGGS